MAFGTGKKYKTMSWNDDQKWEAKWWADCANTFNEEYKQLLYARLMGLAPFAELGRDPVYDLGHKSVLDIGGGPVSMLLKCKNRGKVTVLDPCPYPDWVKLRYATADIEYLVAPAEDIGTRLKLQPYDEVWIYNVLQHTIDPQLIIANARMVGHKIRIFEWIDTPTTIGHPHTLTKNDLDTWLHGVGIVQDLNENNCNGRAYYGQFGGLV